MKAKSIIYTAGELPINIIYVFYTYSAPLVYVQTSMPIMQNHQPTASTSFKSSSWASRTRLPPSPSQHNESDYTYVNPKQFHRILKRRAARKKLGLSARRPYLHESKHQHASTRPRGPGGKFLGNAETKHNKEVKSKGKRGVMTPGARFREEDGVSVASGDDVYCICRKGDYHGWMVACDGGCENWFHGKCVKIREEDGDLIDRYVCPNSREEGSWSHDMEAKESSASKYCSYACGENPFNLQLPDVVARAA